MPDTASAPGSTRDVLIATGLRVLEREGTAGVALRVVAREAGVSHGAPRRYFPTHRALLSAIAARGAALLRADLDAAAVDSDAGARVLACAQAYVDFARRRPAVFELIFRHDLLEGSGEHLRDHTIPLFGWFEQLVADAATDEGGGRTHTIAVQLWVSVHGIAVLAASRAIEVFDAAPDELVAASVAAWLAPGTFDRAKPDGTARRRESTVTGRPRSGTRSRRQASGEGRNGGVASHE